MANKMVDGKFSRWKIEGFTLIELLVVIAILGILATIGLVAFRSSQARSRDAERKSDLKQISSALELYYSDYGKYPSASVDGLGKIAGCPSTTNTSCVWGVGTFWDTKTTYFKALPKDPSGGLNY
jgi:type II secretion system protein G